jgi:hypothetical protein
MVCKAIRFAGQWISTSAAPGLVFGSKNCFQNSCSGYRGAGNG